MKINPSILLGIPLGIVVVSLLIYVSIPDPASRVESGASSTVEGVTPDEAQATPESDDSRQASAPSVAEILLQKYEESEARRQKEIADAMRPVYVPPPLALVEADGMELTPAQAKKLQELRNSFVEGLARLGKDHASPEYLEYWKQEQPRLDDLIRLHLGEDIFLKLSARGFGAMLAEGTARK